MLKKLRHKKTAKKIWIVLAILILPAFVLWGSGSLVRNKEESGYAGKVFGREVSLLEYKDAYDAVKNMALLQFGDNLSEMQQYLNLESQAWERIALLHEAGKRKLRATDKEVVDLIESYPIFQRKGRFDNKTYSDMLRYAFRTQARAFEEQTRQNLILTKLYAQITDGIRVTEDEVKLEYRKANEEVSASYIASVPADFAKGILPSEQELKDYFNQRALEFKQPLSFNVEYVSMDSEEKIKNLYQRLIKKEDLRALAKEFGSEAKETGIFSQVESIPGIGWSPQIIDLLTKLNVGQYSPPIFMDKLYYILKLKEKRNPYIPEFSAIHDKIKETFTKATSEEIAKAKIEGCLNKLKDAYQADPKTVDFGRAAGEMGLKQGETKMFKFGSYLEGIGVSDNIWLIASSLKDGDFSGIISMPSGFYIIKPKTKTAIDEERFKKEKKEFAEKVLSQKKQEIFAKFVEELKIKSLAQ